MLGRVAVHVAFNRAAVVPSFLRSWCSMRKLFSWVTLVAACTCATASFGADRLEATALQLSQSYLREWSTDRRAALARVEEGYAPRVMFYGRILTRAQLYG